MPHVPFSIYLGGAFGQFSKEEVLARQQLLMDLLDASIHVYRPKHQDAYPASLGSNREAVLTIRDSLLFKRADLIVLDVLDTPAEISRGSVLEFGWADALNKPWLILAEETNGHLFNMSRTLASFIVPTRKQAADIINALLT